MNAVERFAGFLEIEKKKERHAWVIPVFLLISSFVIGHQAHHFPHLKRADKLKLHDGSRGCVALIRDNKLLVANSGDYMAIVVSGSDNPLTARAWRASLWLPTVLCCWSTSWASVFTYWCYGDCVGCMDLCQESVSSTCLFVCLWVDYMAVVLPGLFVVYCLCLYWEGASVGVWACVNTAWCGVLWPDPRTVSSVSVYELLIVFNIKY